MDFEKLQEQVSKLEKAVPGIKKADAAALKQFSVGLKDILMAFLKDRREPIRPGQIFKDAAAKSIVPGDIAARGDVLLMRWTGHVTPQDAQAVKDDAERLAAVAEKILPVLKSYKKDK